MRERMCLSGLGARKERPDWRIRSSRRMMMQNREKSLGLGRDINGRNMM